MNPCLKRVEDRVPTQDEMERVYAALRRLLKGEVVELSIRAPQKQVRIFEMRETRFDGT